MISIFNKHFEENVVVILHICGDRTNFLPFYDDLVLSVNIVIGVLNVISQSQFREYQFTMIPSLQKNVIQPN